MVLLDYFQAVGSLHQPRLDNAKKPKMTTVRCPMTNGKLIS
jgi:hypothetical protein